MRRRRAVVLVLVLSGIVLLTVSLLGDLTSAGRYVSLPRRSWERFDPALASRTPDLAALFRSAQERAGGRLGEIPHSQAMEILYGTVADRFTHGDRARYNVFSNWALWLLGGLSPNRGYIQDPDILLRNGHSALCGDVSHVLLRLAERSGIRARHVLLNGHIVMEAFYEGSYHAYDPDLEVTVRDKSGQVLSVRAAAADMELVLRAYAGRGDSEFIIAIGKILGDTSDDVYLVYPPAGIFGESGQRPGRVEQAARHVRYGLPVALLAAGCFFVRGDGRKGGEA